MSDSNASQKASSEKSKEKRARRKPISVKSKNPRRLPWWIELFFVQIGLPEKLLLKILNTHKITTTHIQEHIKSYKLAIIVVASIYYSYPLINHANNQNICVEQTIGILKTQGALKSKQIPLAVSHCQGGDLLEL